MKTNLTSIFIQEFETTYNDLLTHARLRFETIKGKTPWAKRNDIADEAYNKLHAFYTIRLSENSFREDAYTKYLLEHFDAYIKDYEDQNIAYYLEDHLNIVKKKYENLELCIPVNIQLDERNTVRLISQYKATKLFHQRIHSVEQHDNEDLFFQKISFEGYTAPAINKVEESLNSNDFNENQQSSKLKREFTTARQVLAIKYLFEFAKIDANSYDKTQLAYFVQFLTSKETGAKKIQDTGIYKKIKNPFKDKDSEKKEDLKFVRNYFSNLNLSGIVDLINKDMDN